MKKQIIDNNALSNLIKESITEDIILGKIKPGEKLIEAKYAEEFGTSRAPIREAFYLLTVEGLVQKIPRKGTVVKGFSIEEIQDILEIRNFLEELVLEKIRNKDLNPFLDRMDQIIANMENKQTERKEYAKLNHDLHYQLILASESDVIKNMYSRLGTPLLSIQTMSFMEEQNVKKSIADHKQIVRFMRAGQIEEARNLLATHNKAVFPRIQKHLV